MTALIGIDFGTSNASVAIMQDASPHVIATPGGRRVPPVVALGKSGNLLVGHAAKQQLALNPENSFFSLKRLLGRRYDDPEIQTARKRLPFEIKAGPQGAVRLVAPAAGREFSPEQLVAALFERLKEEAEAYLGQPVAQAVIAVPATFDDNQRHAVRRAAGIAGLQVTRIIDEPTAVALAYRLKNPNEETLLVVDLGGGSYDVSLVTIRDGEIGVQAHRSDTGLGGQDLDAAIAGWIEDEFRRRHGTDLAANSRAKRSILEAAEEAKVTLTSETEASIRLPFIFTGNNGPLHLELTLTRSHLRELTRDLIRRLEDPIGEALEEAGIDGHSLDAVILVGGASRMPWVGDAVRRATGREPEPDVDPDHAVATGAALRAALLAGDPGQDKVQDVLPLTVGLESMGGLMTPLIPRNTPLPAQHTEIFSTMEDDQTEVEIHVLQGERPMAADNTSLGRLKLQGIPASPRGVPQIEVTFQIDADGLLRVSAQEAASGAREALSVVLESALSDGDVSRLVEEAEEYAVQDLQQRKLAEARNVARQTVYQTRRSLEYLDGYLESRACRQKRAELRRRLADLETALRDSDAARIRHLTSEIQEAGLILDQLIYRQAQSGDGRSVTGQRSEAGETDEQLRITIVTL